MATKQIQLTPDQRIQRAIISLLRTDPLYADYLLRWPRVIVPRGTMAVNGKELFYNPSFVSGLTEGNLRFILKHEVAHVIFKHTLREVGYKAAETMKDDRLTDDEVRKLMNEAGDLEINDLLLTDPKDARDFPENGLRTGIEQYADHPARMNMEVHYDILRGKHTPPQPEPPQGSAGGSSQDEDGQDGSEEAPEGQERQEQAQDGENDPSEGEGDGTGEGQSQEGQGEAQGQQDGQACAGSGMTDEGTGGMGEFLPDPDAKNPAEAEQKQQQYDQTFLAAAMGAQGQGKLPGWAKELADAITAPAKIPWQILLRRWARKAVRGGESTYSRPSRRTAYRTDIVMPSKRTQSIRRCLFVVDTSGSMATDAVNSSVPEMLKIMQTWKRAELVMVQCDANVGSEEVFKPGQGFRDLKAFARSPQWSGRGGTNMEPAFALVEKYRPEVIICLTDGFMSYPDKAMAKGIPTLWLMVNDTQTPPWGEHLVME